MSSVICVVLAVEAASLTTAGYAIGGDLLVAIPAGLALAVAACSFCGAYISARRWSRPAPPAPPVPDADGRPSPGRSNDKGITRELEHSALLGE